MMPKTFLMLQLCLHPEPKCNGSSKYQTLRLNILTLKCNHMLDILTLETKHQLTKGLKGF